MWQCFPFQHTRQKFRPVAWFQRGISNVQSAMKEVEFVPIKSARKRKLVLGVLTSEGVPL